jgi:hypothetical protein
MNNRKLTDAIIHFGGVVTAAWYVHVCKMETIRSAYDMAKGNDGAPGIDGVTLRASKKAVLRSFFWTYKAN